VAPTPRRGGEGDHGQRELTILKHLLETAVPKHPPLAGLTELDEDEVEVRILTFERKKSDC
jgi:hypothetical protein